MIQPDYKSLEGIKYYIDKVTGQLTICAWCGGMEKKGVEHMRVVTKKLEKKYKQNASHGICSTCNKIY